MITGERVLEELTRHGIDFVGGLHPYDRKQIEDLLDFAIDMTSSLSDDIDNAIDDFADEVVERLKTRISAELSRACDNGALLEPNLAELETALHSEVVDVVCDQQALAKRR